MMDDGGHNFWPLFRAEYVGRIGRVREILNGCYASGFSASDFDRMHQEFDTINGACRVIDRDDIGELARLAASYARHLRTRLPNRVSDSQLLLLEALVVLAEKAIPLINLESDFYCLKESVLPQVRELLTPCSDSDE